MNRYIKFSAFIAALILVACVAFSGCGNNDTEQNEENTTLPVYNENTETNTEENTVIDTTAVSEESSSAVEKATASEESSAADNLSVAEIVELYNTAANKIKKEAKSITRNYKKLKSVEKYLSLPSAISGIGKWAMDAFVKGTDEAHVWISKEDFQIGFPVGNTDYTSKLAENMVQSAECKETSTAYEIKIILHDDAITSPKKGQGYAGVFNTVTASTFEDINVPGVTFESVRVNGINGEITCTVNKSTMKITQITFKNTDILDLGVKALGSKFNAKFALDSEENFTIRY